MHAVDLGCGTGELTQRLHYELRLASTLGLDNSPAMLERCAEYRDEGLSFQLGDASTLQGSYDLIFSHAALQWLDDHPALFAHLKSCLKGDGQLAIQMPTNFDHPAHAAATALAGEFGVAPRQVSVLKPEEYSRILWQLGFRRQHVRLQVFPHVLESRDSVLEWVKGTLLTDYQRRLPPEKFGEFLPAYAQRLQEVLPDEKPFFYPFKRLLIWAS